VAVTTGAVVTAEVAAAGGVGGTSVAAAASGVGGTAEALTPRRIVVGDASGVLVAGGKGVTVGGGVGEAVGTGVAPTVGAKTSTLTGSKVAAGEAVGDGDGVLHPATINANTNMVFPERIGIPGPFCPLSSVRLMFGHMYDAVIARLVSAVSSRTGRFVNTTKSETLNVGSRIFCAPYVAWSNGHGHDSRGSRLAQFPLSARDAQWEEY